MVQAVTKIGNFDGFIARLDKRQTKRLVEKVKLDSLRTAGKIIKDEIQNIIRSGKVEGPPLAEETIKRKGHGQLLIHTREYVDSFISRVDTRKGAVFVGVPKTAVHSKSGTKMSIISMSHEFGGLRTPRRPHIGPGFRKARPKVQKVIGRRAVVLTKEYFK